MAVGVEIETGWEERRGASTYMGIGIVGDREQVVACNCYLVRFFDRVVGLQEGLVVWFGAFKTGPASSGVCRAGRLLATEPGMARKKTRGGE